MWRIIAFGAGLCVAASIAVSSPTLGQAGRVASERPDNARVFDAVWDGIRQNYYDSEAVGADWRHTRDRFRPLAVAAADERELYITVNAMLRTLNDGHTIAAPPSYIALSNQSSSEGLGVGLGVDRRPIGTTHDEVETTDFARLWWARRHPSIGVNGTPAKHKIGSPNQSIRAGQTGGRLQRRSTSQASAQRFLTTHASVYNTFYTQRHLISRSTLRTFRSEATLAA